MDSREDNKDKKKAERAEILFEGGYSGHQNAANKTIPRLAAGSEDTVDCDEPPEMIEIEDGHQAVQNDAVRRHYDAMSYAIVKNTVR